ncbi:aldehyde dehydrogenase family protein [Parvibacter caecicola]|uniref:Succinate-semialdehyde dehydrogenase/glutarate-semialdehyde dehydrogenase n=1 Tax=Parvibacter caecicola TaxID=747645 RepID=A0A7W5GQY6_9ACTN|nr:aldehyde dehydrogenase family protein [Parvibacter caecicola]MBB3171723.1 succinate-semialdehyde dehydrogenase/glutarate-semialdehyde dehydrogenase [Parvibacter caecicola]MCR2040712.1 aldehyde dehydrogenase family protein [Parvibacter caecicola]RNL09423.1 aldehyde dehydrogenase [Parvibacter caecicola]
MKMFIDGKAVEASTGETIDVVNPATGAVVDTVPAATAEDVAHAVACAKAAQKVWAKVPTWQRAEIMMKFLELVERDKEQLARTLSDETGKPITEARAEIGNIPIAFKAFSERAKHLYDEVITAGSEPGQETTVVITRKEPLGVVVAVIPFNFPCDLFDQKVAPALLAGNSCIVKPSTDNPLTLCMLTALLGEAGVTPGAIEIVTGRGSVVGHELCANPDIDLITLTGSTEVGIETAQVAAKTLTHTALELGGNDAFIVMADGDVDLATDEVIWGRMYNTGQVCCASKRFLVHESRVQEFTDKVVEKISALKQGMPAEDDTQIGCLISEKAAIEVERQINLTVEQGGKIVLGGKRNGAFIEPTVIVDVPAAADVAKDMEIFGPVVPIISFATEEEAVAIANSSIFGLSSCVFSADQKTCARVACAMEAGACVINGASFYRSFEEPFGGYKYSGIGTEGVMSTFDEMTHTKSIVLKNIL